MHRFLVDIDDLQLKASVYVLEWPPDTSLHEIIENAYENDRARLALCDLVLVRPPVKWQLSPTQIQSIATEAKPSTDEREKPLVEACSDPAFTFTRLRDKPVHLLHSWEHKHFVSGNINHLVRHSILEGREDIVLESVRRAELKYFVDAGSVKLPPSPGLVYRTPSGKFARSFFRVGNIQRSRAALDALFFWLLPYLRSCVAIVTDTWSISSLSMNASRRLSIYGGQLSTPVPVEMLPRYLDGSREQNVAAVELVERLVQRAREGNGDSHTADKCVLFVVSATHSGSLETNFKRLLTDRGWPSHLVRFVAIFKVGHAPSQMESLWDVSTDDPFGDFAPLSDDEIAKATHTIEIDPYVYFPLKYNQLKLIPEAPHAAQFKKFLDTYQGKQIVRTHKSVEQDRVTRHHAIWIDTEKLVATPEFLDRYDAILRKLDPVPSLIVSPNHAAAEILCQRAKEIFVKSGAAVEVVRHENLLLQTPPMDEEKPILEAIQRVPDDGALLVLDDAFITGARVTRYQTNLRTYDAFKGRIHYVFALSRADAQDTWNFMCRRLKWRPELARVHWSENTCQAVEVITLPLWDETECPWCQETALLREAEGKVEGRAREVLSARLEQLEKSRTDGLSTNLFLGLPNLQFPPLTAGSLFAREGANQAEVFAAVAAAVQNLRTGGQGPPKPPLGPMRFPIATVLDYEQYLKTVYTESVLRASFLRSAKPFELRPVELASEERRQRYMRDLMISSRVNEYDLAAELIFSIAAQKAPEQMLTMNDVEKSAVKLGLEPLLQIARSLSTQTDRPSVPMTRSSIFTRFLSVLSKTLCSHLGK